MKPEIRFFSCILIEKKFFFWFEIRESRRRRRRKSFGNLMAVRIFFKKKLKVWIFFLSKIDWQIFRQVLIWLVVMVDTSKSNQIKTQVIFMNQKCVFYYLFWLNPVYFNQKFFFQINFLDHHHPSNVTHY